VRFPNGVVARLAMRAVAPVPERVSTGLRLVMRFRLIALLPVVEAEP
jgi:hypothetical protein